MKRIVVLILSIFTLFTFSNVYAKDTVYSLNKYSKETFKNIEKSYNSKNEIDGYIIAGSYETKEEIKDEKLSEKVIIVKYDKAGNVLWTYTDDKAKEESSNTLGYTYDEDGKINGYFYTSTKTTEDNKRNVIVKLNLNGKLVEEKTSSLEEDKEIIKLVPSFNNEKKCDGYIGIANSEEQASIIKYDKDFNLLWVKDYEENANYKDIEIINTNGEESGLITLVELKTEEKQLKLIKNDLEGNIEKTIKEDFEETDNPRLEKSDNGFIVYGYTSQLKLSNNKTTSYYLVTFNEEGEETNETVGNTPINLEKTLKLVPIIKENKLEKYLLLYTNDLDSSIEVVEINNQGVETKKIKKINNDYYNILNFASEDETLYIIGQIKCPEEDNCDYNDNSLLIISDEDKVIEVKESDNTSIIIASSIFIGLVVILVILKKFMKKSNKKRSKN